MSLKPLLTVQSIRKSFSGRLALDNLSFELYPGECLAILGPNGAGKTTACEIIAGLLAPDQGCVNICGFTYKKNRDKILNRIGVLLQETTLYKKYTVEETFALFASFYETSLEQEQVLAEVDLQSVKQKRLEHLSGGERQRLYLACALINKPSLLFLDEPTAGLDPSSRIQVWSQIEQIKASERSVLFTTHYLEEAQNLADKVIFLNKGEVIATGTPEDLIRQYQPHKVIDFVLGGSSNQSRVKSLLKSHYIFDEAHFVGPYLRLNSKDPTSVIHQAEQKAQANGLTLKSVLVRDPNLEDVFLYITQRRKIDASSQLISNGSV